MIGGKGAEQMRIISKSDGELDPGIYKNGFCIIKLNGSAFGYYWNNGYSTNYFNTDISISNVKQFLDVAWFPQAISE